MRANFRFAFLGLLAVLSSTHALASGPRWVTGPPYFTARQAGQPVQWYTRTPLYFTDPGDLSPSVTHAAADAMVSAAASVWNIPTAMFQIAQGGTLAEHVSSANSSMATSGVVFPSDVQSSNSASIQIAVVYDSDGSVTDLLMGQDASSPLECAANGVTESVDSISTDGYIHHAVLILNGRCSGPAPEQQLQLQYQLERAFGRVFGLGWSQTNDNVFTRTPTPTLEQALHWPIMHPIDIVCGQYTYQCLPQPFTLRDDDIASITQLYPRGYSNQYGWTGYNVNIAGKVQSYDRAAHAYGSVSFASGQGMQGVNLVLQRREMFYTRPEAFQDVSTVSGFLFQQDAGNPVTGVPSGIAASMGTTNAGLEGYFDFAWIPMINDREGWVDILVTPEPVNPLYTGSHAVGPYTTGTVAPSGVPTSTFISGLYPNDAGFYATDISFSMGLSPAGCPTQSDGTEATPATVTSTGLLNAAICGRNHTSWFTFSIRPGRTAAAEVTALDETGAPTQVKARPLLGLWNSADPTGSTPTLASTAEPFNTTAVGTTGLSISGQTAALRLAVTDARGDGRPDYTYTLRILAADTVQPATIPTPGAPLTITGMGFRAGNQVLINGVPATVTNSSPNSISAIAPPVSAFSRTPSAPVNITVRDPQTGGTSTIFSALTYGAATPYTFTLVSAPSGTVAVGTAPASPLAVRLVQGNSATPVSGIPVVFTTQGGTVAFSGCSGSPCTATTDSTGLATVTLSPNSFGNITVQASALGLTQSASFTALSRTIAPAHFTQYVAGVANVAWTSRAILLENGAPATGVAVSWSASGLALASAENTSSTSGSVQARLSAAALAGSSQAQVCGWVNISGGSVCATFSAVPVAPSDWSVALANGAGQSVTAGGSYTPVTLAVTDHSGNPVAGATVSIYQAVNQAQMDCPARGVCPVPAPLATLQGTALSDADGNVSFQPLQVPGTAATTNVVITTGTQGFLSLSLTQTP